MCTKSACMVPITSRDGVSTEMSGFKVFGSPRSDTTRRSPRRPTSPGSTSNSSFSVVFSGGEAIARRPINVKAERSRVERIQQRLKFAVGFFTLGSPEFSILSCTLRLARATNSPAPGILDRTALLPPRANTSTNEKSKHCIAAGLRAGCPSSAPAQVRPSRETTASSPPARIVVSEWPPVSKAHWKFRAKCGAGASIRWRSEEHTSELQSHHDLVCRLLLEKKKKTKNTSKGGCKSCEERHTPCESSPTNWR